MKIDKQAREIMKDGIKGTLKAFNIKAKDVVTIELMNQLWFKSFQLKTYTRARFPNLVIDFPTVTNKEYPLYPCDSNDKTIDTALKTIFKELK
jgi:hypothetical protein